jgi:hypothetical protein
VLSALPYACAVAGMIAIAHSADRRGEPVEVPEGSRVDSKGWNAQPLGMHETALLRGFPYPRPLTPWGAGYNGRSESGSLCGMGLGPRGIGLDCCGGYG